jgi:hypothetical protein
MVLAVKVSAPRFSGHQLDDLGPGIRRDER